MKRGNSPLPVSFGGLGVRSATDLALPTFLASVTASADFISQLLPSRLRHVTIQQSSVRIMRGRVYHINSHVPCPFPPFSSAQKSWDWPLLKLKFDNVMSAVQSSVGRARLLAVASPHSGDFFNAIPCSSVRTRLDNSHRDSATSWCANLRSQSVRLRRKRRPIWCSWSVVPAVCRSSFATQRRQ